MTRLCFICRYAESMGIDWLYFTQLCSFSAIQRPIENEISNSDANHPTIPVVVLKIRNLITSSSLGNPSFNNFQYLRNLKGLFALNQRFRASKRASSITKIGTFTCKICLEVWTGYSYTVLCICELYFSVTGLSV